MEQQKIKVYGRSTYKTTYSLCTFAQSFPSKMPRHVIEQATEVPVFIKCFRRSNFSSRLRKSCWLAAKASLSNLINLRELSKSSTSSKSKETTIKNCYNFKATMIMLKLIELRVNMLS